METISTIISFLALLVSIFVYCNMNTYQTSADISIMKSEFYRLASLSHGEYRTFEVCTKSSDCILSHPDFEYRISQMEVIKERLNNLIGNSNELVTIEHTLARIKELQSEVQKKQK